MQWGPPEKEISKTPNHPLALYAVASRPARLAVLSCGPSLGTGGAYYLLPKPAEAAGLIRALCACALDVALELADACENVPAVVHL